MNGAFHVFKVIWYAAIVAMLTCSCAGKKNTLPRSEEIYEDFRKSPSGAVHKYRSLWQQSAERDQDLSARDRLSLLFMTQQLMEKDNAGYDGYYSYAMEKAKSDNSEVAAFAMSALGSARDAKATDVLAANAKASHALVRRSAIDAIAWQVAKLEHASGGANDYQYARSKMKVICEEQSSDGYVKSACERVGLSVK